MSSARAQILSAVYTLVIGAAVAGASLAILAGASSIALTAQKLTDSGSWAASFILTSAVILLATQQAILRLFFAQRMPRNTSTGGAAVKDKRIRLSRLAVPFGKRLIVDLRGMNLSGVTIDERRRDASRIVVIAAGTGIAAASFIESDHWTEYLLGETDTDISNFVSGRIPDLPGATPQQCVAVSSLLSDTAAAEGEGSLAVIFGGIFLAFGIVWTTLSLV